jgi:hypothetical protein
LHSDGVKVVIATGRRYRTTKFVIDNLGLELAVICNGGALVKDDQEVTLHESSFGIEELEHVVSTARQFNITISAQRDSHTSGGADFILDTFHPWNKQTRRYFDDNASYADTANLFSLHENFLVLGAFDQRDTLEKYSQALLNDPGGRFNTVIVPHQSTGFHYCEVTQNHVTKWHGLEQLIQSLNITGENICAVGDELNDLPMVKAAGHGVAMGNGNPDLKAVADFVCGDHDRDGLLDVVDYINRHNAIHG